MLRAARGRSSISHRGPTPRSRPMQTSRRAPRPRRCACASNAAWAEKAAAATSGDAPAAARPCVSEASGTAKETTSSRPQRSHREQPNSGPVFLFVERGFGKHLAYLCAIFDVRERTGRRAVCLFRMRAPLVAIALLCAGCLTSAPMILPADAAVNGVGPSPPLVVEENQDDPATENVFGDDA